CLSTPHAPLPAAAVPRPCPGRPSLLAAVVEALIASLLWTVPAQGDTIIYTGTGRPFGFGPDPVPAGASATMLFSTSFGFGVNPFFGNPPPSVAPFDSFGPPGTNYVSFTVTPDPGKALDLVSFSFDEENVTAFGPTRWDVFTSVDGFMSSL